MQGLGWTKLTIVAGGTRGVDWARFEKKSWAGGLMAGDENGANAQSGFDLEHNAVLTVLPTPVVVAGPLDQGLPIAFVNQAFSELTGYAAEECVGKGWAFLAGEASDRGVVSELFWAIVERRRVRRDLLVYHRDGSTFWAEIAAAPAMQLQPGGGVVLAFNDVSHRYIDADRERQAASYLAGVVRNLPGFVFRYALGPDGRVEYAGVPEFVVDPASKDAGLTKFDLIGLAHPEDVDRAQAAVSASIANRSGMSTELRLRSTGGEDRWVRMYSAPWTEGEDVAWYGVGIDVTGEKSAALRLEHLGKHDLLTGLADRYRLIEAIEQAVVQAGASGEALELSQAKLTRLGEICETLGPGGGDAALRAAANAIVGLAVNGRGLAARVATDEFAIFHRYHAGEEGGRFHPALMKALLLPVRIDDHFAMLDPTIGTARLTPGEMDGNRPESIAMELIKRASMALAAARRGGAGTHQSYSPEVDHRIQNRMVLRHALHQAIIADDFMLHYQPIVDLRSGRILGGEALVRWHHPRFGLVRPDVFIPLAEESGLIGSLGELVMRKALRQFRTWRDAGLALPMMAINVSPVQIKAGGLDDTVRRAIEEAGVPPGCVELEITEGILLGHSPGVIATMGALKSTGVSIAIDDFGAGYSSFHYLRDFPFDTLKIDQIFVRQLSLGSNDALIVQAIAALAQCLNLSLVAEGVETTEQRDFLIAQGCEVGQGYFFSRPVPADAFAELLESGEPLPAGSRYERGAGAA